MMKKVIERHNRIIQIKWISSIRKLPNHKNLSCLHDPIFDLPIPEITPDQKSNLKKLIQ